MADVASEGPDVAVHVRGLVGDEIDDRVEAAPGQVREDGRVLGVARRTRSTAAGSRSALLAPGEDRPGSGPGPPASAAQAVERLPVPPRNRIFTLRC